MNNYLNDSLWVSNVWHKNTELYAKTCSLPIIEGIIKGDLIPSIFRYYIEQDSIYIHHFTEVLLSLKERVAPPFQVYIDAFVKENMEAEKELHKRYLADINVDCIEPSVTCKAFIEYNNHLKSLSNIAYTLAGILPCFLVYQQLGKHIYNNHIAHNNPFIDWINTYNGAEHIISVHQMVEMCNYYAKRLDDSQILQMDYYYQKGCKWDYLFWMSCYEDRSL